MPIALLLLAFALVSVLGSCHARRREQKGKHPGFFFRFWRHAAGILRTGPLLVLALAVVLTWTMIFLGWDRSIQVFFQTKNPLGRSIPWTVLVGGNFWLIIPAVLFYLYGKWKADLARMGAGLAATQALLVNFLLNTSQKILSGRRGPAHLLGIESHRQVHFIKTKNPADFSFDFWNHTPQDGRFFWPSGHTAAAFAFVSALRVYYPEKRWIPWVGYPFALFTALAMVDGDFHWASDVVAGALLGEVVGRIVGRGFRLRYRPPKAEPG